MCTTSLPPSSFPLSLCHARIQPEGSIPQARKTNLTRHKDQVQHLDPALPSSRTMRNTCLLLMSPSLWPGMTKIESNATSFPILSGSIQRFELLQLI